MLRFTLKYKVVVEKSGLFGKILNDNNKKERVFLRWMRLKEIALENRPRERFLKDGVGVLSDGELLAVILQVNSGLSMKEKVRAEELVREKYGDGGWTGKR